MPQLIDEAFLSRVRLKSYKVLTPDKLRYLSTSKIGSLTELLTVLQGLDVVSCLQSEFKVGEQLPLDITYMKLIACWVNDLRKLIELFKPSSKVVDFTEAYVSKYFAYEFITALTEGYSYRAVFLSEEIQNAISQSNYVYEILSRVGKLNKQFPTIVKDVLVKYREKRLKDLDRYLLLVEYEEMLYNRLTRILKDLHADPYAFECLNKIRSISLSKAVIREAFVRKEALKELTSFSVKERASLEKVMALNNPHLLEEVLAFLPFLSCEKSLRTLPLGYADLLHFLILKDWESLILSNVVYIINLGYGPENVVESFKRWLEVYDFITS